MWSDNQKKIVSGSLEEKEYGEHHEQHFNDPVGLSSARRRISLLHTGTVISLEKFPMGYR